MRKTLRKAIETNRRKQQRLISAAHEGGHYGAWQFYEAPEGVEDRPSTSSLKRHPMRTRPVGAIREIPNGIEIRFFPR